MLFVDEGERRRIGQKIKRVLIIDRDPQMPRLLGDLLSNSLQCRVFTASALDSGYALAKSANPDLIFVEHPASGVDGYALTAAIRRAEIECRRAPVIMFTAEATAAAILAARDSGVDEFLRKPFTTDALARRVQAAAFVERAWIEVPCYVGPDRRRFNSADYAGPRRRLEET